MQICTIPNTKESQVAPRTLFEAFVALSEEHNNIAIIQVEKIDFIVKALGRKDYRDIMLNQELDTYLKEEAICEICCLYPEHFDFEACDAGIPSKLYEDIIDLSFLNNNQEEERSKLMHYYRHEMIELHNQINCLISEAFPSLQFDEIENFDMVTALKYLSRAEWILQNLRNFDMNFDPFTGKEWSPDSVESEAPVEDSTQHTTPPPQSIKEQATPKVVPPGVPPEKSFIPGETVEERIERLKRGEIKKEKLTPQKLAQLEQQFPEINWRQQLDEQDFASNIDTTPAALRTPSHRK